MNEQLDRLRTQMEKNWADKGLPSRMFGGFWRYFNARIPPGHFLIAIITNDLREAVARADSENMRLLPEYVMFLYNDVPGSCWGNEEKYDAWLRGTNE